MGSSKAEPAGAEMVSLVILATVGREDCCYLRICFAGASSEGKLQQTRRQITAESRKQEQGEGGFSLHPWQCCTHPKSAPGSGWTLLGAPGQLSELVTNTRYGSWLLTACAARDTPQVSKRQLRASSPHPALLPVIKQVKGRYLKASSICWKLNSGLKLCSLL